MIGCLILTEENSRMPSWFNIKAKLIIVLVTVSLIPLAVVGWYSLEESRNSISREVFNHLVSIRDAKKAQITRLFQKNIADIRVLAKSSHIDTALDAFSSVVRDGEVDKTQFDYFESLAYGPSFLRFIEEYDYYDLMLVNNQGDIVYSTKKESDFAQNLLTGPLKDSLFGRSFKSDIDEVVITDFELYPASQNQVISFLIAPVETQSGTVGAIVLKMTNNAINEIMMERSGMGATGEAYLVGNDNLMRSDSYLDQVNRTVAASFLNPKNGSVDTKASRAALSGKIGHQIIIDYRGQSVLSAYLPIKLGRITFALMAEIDQVEAFNSIDRLQQLVVILSSIVGGLMLISAYFISNIITKPILSLTHSSIEIAEGNLDQEIKVTRSDELGVLSENFNRMRLSIRNKIKEIEENREALREANETLEERVQMRTQELAHKSTLLEAVLGSINQGLIAYDDKL